MIVQMIKYDNLMIMIVLNGLSERRLNLCTIRSVLNVIKINFYHVFV